MKSRHAVQVRRRIRLSLGWGLILSVAVAELWVLGQFASGFSQTSAGSQWQWQAAPPLLEFVMPIR
jgi:hypothetical protein